MTSFLVVDDSRIIRKITRKILEELSFTCEEAENGQQAMDICRRQMPDAIILDWNMPVMNGIEFLHGLRAVPGGRMPKVILCSTENDAPHIEQALAAGADEYIMKPFDSEIMQTKLVQVGLIQQD